MRHQRRHQEGLQVDWCLTSRTRRRACPRQVLHAGARACACRRSRARRQIAQPQPARAIQYSGLPRRKIEATHMTIAPGDHGDEHPQRRGAPSAAATWRRISSPEADRARRHRRARALALQQEVGEGRRGRRARACRAGTRAAAARPRRGRAPMPVSTRCGSQPAAAPACRSRRRVADHRHVAPGRRRSARRSAGTGPAAACGSRSLRRGCAGRRTPRRCGRRRAASILCILACIALSEATSNRPRPRPDWFDATTTCQPAWLSRAIASSAPGSGVHSSGVLTKSSRSHVDGAVAVEDDELHGVRDVGSGGEPLEQVGDAVHRRVQRRQQAQAVERAGRALRH